MRLSGQITIRIGIGLSVGDSQTGELSGDERGQHIGNGMLGAPVTCNHKADPLLFGQQRNVMCRLPGDKAVRPAVDSLLQVAAAPAADLGQTCLLYTSPSPRDRG